MRPKSRMPATGPRLETSQDEFATAAKTRASTPEGAGGPFWVQTPPVHHPMEAAGETGFISSQPSMAEFMTALPHLGTNELTHGPQISPQHTPPGGFPMDVPHGMNSPGVNVPEYPWMKEKKTTRKNSQQGTVKIRLPFLPLDL
ncbi:unnamed protein product [Acanthoscelides obtectus]|uniref:Uncharacterized protein n=1 Tax=Acanthoscelides obtectus TaxID=200917 RepID=A0A9P0KG57_ACAOB|nr:unnamed protein product [Acanthoscelides obtectus]CAK1654481.1 Homeobox protein Hox-A2 [Acanthoscelides obtectus]